MDLYPPDVRFHAILGRVRAPVGVSYFRVHTLGVADFGVIRQCYCQNSAIIPLSCRDNPFPCHRGQNVPGIIDI